MYNVELHEFNLFYFTLHLWKLPFENCQNNMQCVLNIIIIVPSFWKTSPALPCITTCHETGKPVVTQYHFFNLRYDAVIVGMLVMI